MESKTCKKCITPCAKCISATFCLECGFDPSNRRYLPPNCKCSEMFSDHGDKCDTCTAPCTKCFGFGWN